jgi:hypothetical protein
MGEDLEKTEERRHLAQVEHLEARQAARAQDAHVPDIEFVQQADARARQQGAAMAQHVVDLAGVLQHHERGMTAEMRAMMEGLYATQAEAANRQRIADEVSRGFMDSHMTGMQRLLAAREMVAPSANIYPRVHHTTNLHQTVMQDQT